MSEKCEHRWVFYSDGSYCEGCDFTTLEYISQLEHDLKIKDEKLRIAMSLINRMNECKIKLAQTALKLMEDVE